MNKILLIAITTLIAVSTGLSLEPMKVAFYTTNTGSQTVHAEIKDNSSGTTHFVGENFTLTPNGNGIIIIDMKDHGGANGNLTNVLPTAVNTHVTVDIYVGTTLFSQQRLDALLLAHTGTDILDDNGNFTPPISGSGNIGTDELRWSSGYFEGETVHIGPAYGEANNTEMTLSYDDNTNTGTITVDTVDVIDVTKGAIILNKSVSQNIGNDNTVFGTNAAINNTGINVTAIGANSAIQNRGSGLTAIGASSAMRNTGQLVTATGYSSASENTGDNLVANGYFSAVENRGDNVTAIGRGSASENTGNSLTAAGYYTARANIGNNIIAIGETAAVENRGNNVIAIGVDAARKNVGDDVIAIGTGAGWDSTNGNTVGNVVILSGSSLTAYPNKNYADAVFGGMTLVSGNYYLYYNQALGTVGAYLAP